MKPSYTKHAAFTGCATTSTRHTPEDNSALFVASSRVNKLGIPDSPAMRIALNNEPVTTPTPTSARERLMSSDLRPAPKSRLPMTTAAVAYPSAR